MKGRALSQLSRRERQIMNIIYGLGHASVADVVERMDDAPSYDSVRITLGILVRKRYLTHKMVGRRYVYRPTIPRRRASRSAVRNLVQTFFGGSSSRAILTLLDESAGSLSNEELAEIEHWLEVQKEKDR